MYTCQNARKRAPGSIYRKKERKKDPNILIVMPDLGRNCLQVTFKFAHWNFFISRGAF